MYCVNCGVKLQDGAAKCPLCHTPAWHPEGGAVNTRLYSDQLPEVSYHRRYAVFSIITAAMLALCLACLIFCLETYGMVFWSGYVMLSLAAVWIIFLLPLVFRKWEPLIFLPIDFAAICGLLLYICLYTKGHWFLSFAFPVVMIVMLLTLTAVVLYRYIKKGTLYVTGGLFIAIGLSFMLVEFFLHITFGRPMFLWSLYCVTAFCLLGMFLILAAMIRPLREYLERKFFV